MKSIWAKEVSSRSARTRSVFQKLHALLVLIAGGFVVRNFFSEDPVDHAVAIVTSTLTSFGFISLVASCLVPGYLYPVSNLAWWMIIFSTPVYFGVGLWASSQCGDSFDSWPGYVARYGGVSLSSALLLLFVFALFEVVWIGAGTGKSHRRFKARTLSTLALGVLVTGGYLASVILLFLLDVPWGATPGNHLMVVCLFLAGGAVHGLLISTYDYPHSDNLIIPASQMEDPMAVLKILKTLPIAMQKFLIQNRKKESKEALSRKERFEKCIYEIFKMNPRVDLALILSQLKEKEENVATLCSKLMNETQPALDWNHLKDARAAIQEVDELLVGYNSHQFKAVISVLWVFCYPCAREPCECSWPSQLKTMSLDSLMCQRYPCRFRHVSLTLSVGLFFMMWVGGMLAQLRAPDLVLLKGIWLPTLFSILSLAFTLGFELLLDCVALRGLSEESSNRSNKRRKFDGIGVMFLPFVLAIVWGGFALFFILRQSFPVGVPGLIVLYAIAISVIHAVEGFFEEWEIGGEEESRTPCLFWFWIGHLLSLFILAALCLVVIFLAPWKVDCSNEDDQFLMLVENPSYGVNLAIVLIAYSTCCLIVALTKWCFVPICGRCQNAKGPEMRRVAFSLQIPY